GVDRGAGGGAGGGVGPRYPAPHHPGPLLPSPQPPPSPGEEGGPTMRPLLSPDVACLPSPRQGGRAGDGGRGGGEGARATAEGPGVRARAGGPRSPYATVTSLQRHTSWMP